MKIHRLILLLLLLAPLTGWSASLADYLAENDSIHMMQKFKDSPEMIRLKLAQVALINQKRKALGLQPLQLDILASRVANRHAYFSSIYNYKGHWDFEGKKPYQRYAAAGGKDHISENACMAKGGAFDPDNPAQIASQMKAGLIAFLDEGPGGGHYENVMTPSHNYVGLGFFATNFDGLTQIRYYEEYIDRYAEWDEFPTKIKAGESVTLSGRVIPEDTGVYAVIVYYEALPQPMSRREIEAKDSYPDFTSSTVKEWWPWNIDFDENNRSFKFELQFPKPGSYYVHIYIKKGIDTIPYRRGGSASTEGLVNISGIVFEVH